jgi:hypothetical protein
VRSTAIREVIETQERVLVPWMGPATEAAVAVLRGAGVDAEALPEPTRESLRLGRRHTSGKECIPMALTLGSVLERIEAERENDRKFVFFMPNADGPCRFGVYKELHQITLDRLGWSERVRIWSPDSRNYFEGVPPGVGPSCSPPSPRATGSATCSTRYGRARPAPGRPRRSTPAGRGP